MTRKARKLGPSLEPQDIASSDAWYYESRRGIEVYTDPDRGGVIGPIMIPWWRLMKSAARCGWTVRKAPK